MGLTLKKELGIWGLDFSKIVQKRQKLVRIDPHPIILGISRTRNDARRVRNVMETLQTPKTAIKN